MKRSLILKTIIGLSLSIIVLSVSAQKSKKDRVIDHEKEIYAKSIINQKAPKLEVEEWLSKVPNTQNKFVLIDFWATWCGPCLKVIPELNEWHEKFGDKLVIIGLSSESADKVRAADNIKMDYYSAIDTKRRLITELAVEAIPHCLLIDQDGIVRWEGYPSFYGYELTTEVITDIITKYEKHS